MLDDALRVTRALMRGRVGRARNGAARQARAKRGGASRALDIESLGGRRTPGENATTMTKPLASLLAGRWIAPNADAGKTQTLVNPTTEAPLAVAGTDGVDFGEALAFARDVGGPALRALSFRERGELLRKASRIIHAHRDELLQLGIENAGNTRSDAKFDVDGGSGTMAAYADLGAELGDTQLLVDGEPSNIGRSSRIAGQHVWLPLEGAALHINAFNFPAWGLGEKLAVAILAGVPVISKPATSTALLAHRIVELWDAESVFPKGALSLVVGGTGDLVGRLGGQDVLAFTGSSDTAAVLRGSPNVAHDSVRVNIEADSLNAAVLAPDAEPGSEVFELFIKDVARDVTQKAGQKCTAIRRVFVPRERLEAVRDALADRLMTVRVGDPSRDEVEVGPLATKKQQRDVLAGIERLRAAGARVVCGGGEPKAPIGVEPGRGYFVAPTLLEATDLATPAEVHAFEVFGPVATLIPYDDVGSLTRAIRAGGGGLVSSVYGDDKAFLRALVVGVASALGRIVIGSEKIAAASLPPGTVLPNLVHGGPGRAGGGEELGGLRGLRLYSQRTALQGYGPLVAAIVAEGKRVTL